jgi:hypothetical protein
VKTLARHALEPLRRWLVQSIPAADPWERLSYSPPAQSLGRGSVHEFAWYLEGETTVAVASVDDVCAWLLDCEYVCDPELFHEDDFWQHPSTFERLRQGDCEDHAIWAWRKLAELGLEVELMSGTWRPDDSRSGGHVWVRFREGDDEYILESVSESRDAMLRRLADVRDEYVPHAGVDGQCRLHAYGGMLQDD